MKHAMLMPDGSVVFESCDHLVSWVEAWDREREHLALVTPDDWTEDLVNTFVHLLGRRSRLLIQDVINYGRQGMLAKEFGIKIDSSVIGLGKRFEKLERDAVKFSKYLPVPARLGGRPGERVLVVDPGFISAWPSPIPRDIDEPLAP